MASSALSTFQPRRRHGYEPVPKMSSVQTELYNYVCISVTLQFQAICSSAIANTHALIPKPGRSGKVCRKK